MKFSEKVKIVRDKLSISQETLAKELGVSFATINRWENENFKPSKLGEQAFEEFCKKHGIIFANTNLASSELRKKKTLKFVDLFSGMGGTRIGLQQALNDLGYEYECVLTSEIKESAVRALKENFNNEKILGDIKTIDASHIPDFDILLGGFPCQAFSSAGNRLGFLDTRGTLFFEVERILKAKRPPLFILENVEGLVNHDKIAKTDKIGRTLNTILNHLRDLGYKVAWKVLDSKDFGVAQSRKRIYILGSLFNEVNLDNFDVIHTTFGKIKEHGLPCVKSKFTDLLLSHYSLDELKGKSIKDKRGGENNIHSWDFDLKGQISGEQKKLMNRLFKERRKKHWAKEMGIDWMDGMPLTLKQISTFYNGDNLPELLQDLVNKKYLVKEHPKKLVTKKINGGEVLVREEDLTKPEGYNIVTGKLSFEFSKILDDNDVTPTLVAMDVSKLGVIDQDGIRRLTLREGLRLFGYPENYTLSMFENNNNGLLKAFDLLGNTVVVNVIRAVAKRLLLSL